METIKRSVVAGGWRARRDEEGECREFLGQRNHFDIIIRDICHYKFAQSHRRYNIKSKPKWKLWTMSDNDVSI